ncbi:protein ORF151B [Cyprinid herpesvirus 1]|uniref:Protein ORF151B n=1 Tax=Cyprinid herpesvirus 1 TaxID=317858 RepID=K7PBY9_9VIRU|nr:protein ORF151B [Cyprinid herpesvirus 1]AFJ20443.1 protein ORF151B [Cyprinid herpesvirus 1]
MLKSDNAGLSNTASVLRDRVAQLKQKVLRHMNSGCPAAYVLRHMNSAVSWRCVSCFGVVFLSNVLRVLYWYTLLLFGLLKTSNELFLTFVSLHCVSTFVYTNKAVLFVKYDSGLHLSHH